MIRLLPTLIATALAVVALFGRPAPAVACSAPAVTVEEVAAASTFIAVADVLEAPNRGLNYRLRIVDLVRGEGRAGDEVIIGPHNAAPGVTPGSCSLTLPLGERIVVALPDPHNLNALSSYAWWMQGGHLSSASGVVSWPDSISALVARLRAGASMPSTDSLSVAGPWSEAKRPTDGLLALVVGAAALGFGARWRRAPTGRSIGAQPASAASIARTFPRRRR